MLSALHIPMVHTRIAEFLGVTDIHRMMETDRDATSNMLELLRIRLLRELQQQLRIQEEALLARAAGLRRRIGSIEERIDDLF